MSTLSIVEVEGPLQDVVNALQGIGGPHKLRRMKALWDGGAVRMQIGRAAATAFWVDEDHVTVLNIQERLETGATESVVDHLSTALPYEVTSSLKFVA